MRWFSCLISHLIFYWCNFLPFPLTFLCILTISTLLFSLLWCHKANRFFVEFFFWVKLKNKSWARGGDRETRRLHVKWKNIIFLKEKNCKKDDDDYEENFFRNQQMQCCLQKDEKDVVVVVDDEEKSVFDSAHFFFYCLFFVMPAHDWISFL